MNMWATTVSRLLVFILMGVSPSGYALSCHGLQDQFFVQCGHGVCEKSFRVREVHAKGSCGRRVIVEDVPDSMVQYIRKELVNEKIVDEKAIIYHIFLIDSFYHKAPESSEELARNFREKDSVYARQTKIEVLPQGTDFELLKKNWMEQSDKELQQTRAYYLIDVSTLACCVILLIYTSVKYGKLTLGHFFRDEANQRKVLILLFVQVGLLGFGMVPWLIYLEGAVYMLLLTPLVIIAWIFQVMFYVIVRFRLQSM